MHRSVSEPSLGTITGTIGTTGTRTSIGQPLHEKQKSAVKRIRGSFLFEGRTGKMTRFILMEPWNVWFKGLVLMSVVYKYISHFLKAYYFRAPILLLDITTVFGEIIYGIDVMVHLLHAFWPLVRVHMRVYRRNIILLCYDVISLFPWVYIFKYEEQLDLVLLGRWLGIGRIYRLIYFFQEINENMRTSRLMLYLIEHMLAVILILHAGTCLWYDIHMRRNGADRWHIGYPGHVDSRRMKFDSYSSCWYYCTCRFFNVIFGDAFPLRNAEKWVTSALMLIGYVFFRYEFIGSIAWEIVLSNSRMCNFVDRYHHMISYLRLRGAPDALVQQAVLYKQRLWHMKNGILNTRELQKLPLPLQMELIFDINVGHFHNTLLFRDTDEAFMRQISLLMSHHIFLSGQYIWSQGVVKSGMLCIKRGVVEMLSDEDDESPMIAFKEGTVLGELSLFYSIPSKVTVRAASYVEVQVLRRTDFMRVISEHPFMLKRIRGKIESRLKKSRHRQEAIMKYDKDDSRLIRTRYRPMKVLKDNLAGVEEEDPTFVDDSHMYYKDENNVRQPKFTPEFLELYQMTNNVTTIDAPRICLRSSFPWILEPNTDFIHMFDMAHFAMVLYLCVMAPHNAIQNYQTDTEKVISTVVMAGLLFNIYIQLTTAIIEKNIRKVTVKEIAEVKMASPGFYVDIISVFPAYIFSDTLDPQGESVAGQFAKLFPALQVWHIWDYIGKWERNFDANIKFLSLIKYCLIFLIFCYWSGCFLYLFACPRKLCRENSWMSQLIYWETKVFMTNEAKHERPTLTSFSFGSSVFTNSGMSDIAPGFNDYLVKEIAMERAKCRELHHYTDKSKALKLQ